MAAGDVEIGVEGVEEYPVSDARGFHRGVVDVFGPVPPRPVTWKAALLIYLCVLSIIMPLGGSGALAMIPLPLPATLAVLLPPILAFVVLIYQPILFRLVGPGWMATRACPGTRCEPARSCEEGFCCYAPHPRFEAAVQGILAVRREAQARLSGLASRVARTEVDIARVAPEGLAASLMLRVPIVSAEQDAVRKALQAAVDSLSGAAAGTTLVTAEDSATLFIQFPNAAALLEWRRGPVALALLDAVPNGNWVQEIRLGSTFAEGVFPAAAASSSSSGAATLALPPRPSAAATAPPQAPASLSNAFLVPHRPLLLYKMMVVITIVLYPTLLFIGFPLGAATVAAGAPPAVGTFITISTAVPFVGFIGAPFASLLFARWLSDPDSGECAACPPRVRNFLHGGIFTCCPPPWGLPPHGPPPAPPAAKPALRAP